MPAEAKPFLRDLASGKDEMNLVEMPIFLLSSRPPDGVQVLDFKLEDFDPKLKQVVQRQLTVIGDAAHGLPTAAAEKVYLALMHHARAYNNFSDPLVYFSRAEMLKTLKWPNKKESYQRLTLAMNQLAGVRLKCVNYWRDNRAKQYHRVRENIGVLDEFKFRDSRRKGEGDFRAYLSEFRWGATLFESFQANYIKTLDLSVAMSLKPLALRLYRLLDKRFYAPQKTTVSFEIRELAFERLGMSRRYHLGEVRRNLRKAISELVATGYLESVDADQVFVEEAGRSKVVFRLSSAFSQRTVKRATNPKRTHSVAGRPELRLYRENQQAASSAKKPKPLDATTRAILRQLTGS